MIYWPVKIAWLVLLAASTMISWVPITLAAPILLYLLATRSKRKRPFPEATAVAACVTLPMLVQRRTPGVLDDDDYFWFGPDTFGLEYIQFVLTRFLWQFEYLSGYVGGGQIGVPFTWLVRVRDYPRINSFDSTALMMNIGILLSLVFVTYLLERFHHRKKRSTDDQQPNSPETAIPEA